MLVTKKKFQSLVDSHKKLVGKVLSNEFKYIEAQKDMKSIVDIMMLQEQRISNLIEIVRNLVSDKDRKKIIAETKDGTKLTIGDFLDAEDLFPRVEEEYNSMFF